MLATFWVALLGLIAAIPGNASVHEQVASFFGNPDDRHTNNWAVLACTSRYWFNYRVCLST